MSSIPLNIEMLTESIAMGGFDTANITYSFSSSPKITATSADNVNVYVENVTKSGCTIRTSAPINGTVYVHIIGNK